MLGRKRQHVGDKRGVLFKLRSTHFRKVSGFADTVEGVMVDNPVKEKDVVQRVKSRTKIVVGKATELFMQRSQKWITLVRFRSGGPAPLHSKLWDYHGNVFCHR